MSLQLIGPSSLTHSPCKGQARSEAVKTFKKLTAVRAKPGLRFNGLVGLVLCKQNKTNQNKTILTYYSACHLQQSGQKGVGSTWFNYVSNDSTPASYVSQCVGGHFLPFSFAPHGYLRRDDSNHRAKHGSHSKQRGLAPRPCKSMQKCCSTFDL